LLRLVTQLSSLLRELSSVQLGCWAAGLLFWPVEAIMVWFFTVRVSQNMANGSLWWFPPNRMVTLPEFHKKSRIYLSAD